MVSKPHSILDDRDFLKRDAQRTIRDFADDPMEESLVRFARAYLDLEEQLEALRKENDRLRESVRLRNEVIAEHERMIEDLSSKSSGGQGAIARPGQPSEESSPASRSDG